MKNTAQIDLDVFNRALLLLQQVSGEVSHAKVHPIVQCFAQSIIPPTEEAPCPSPTRQSSSSRKSATDR